SGGLVSAEEVAEPSDAPLVVPAEEVADLDVRTFERALDRVWRRTSYSGITSGLHEAGAAAGRGGDGGTAASEPEEPGILDEPGLVPPPEGLSVGSTTGGGLASPMGGLRVG